MRGRGQNCVPPPGAVPLDATATDGVDAVAAEARGTMTRKTNNVAFVDKLRVDDATAAAMKKRSEAYATLDDIVLDFDPSLDTAQKLLLIGGYFSSSPTEVATRLAEVTALALAPPRRPPRSLPPRFVLCMSCVVSLFCMCICVCDTYNVYVYIFLM